MSIIPNISYVVILQGDCAIGPFKTQSEADTYIATDWQGSEMTVMELYVPADSTEDRA